MLKAILLTMHIAAGCVALLTAAVPRWLRRRAA